MKAALLTVLLACLSPSCLVTAIPIQADENLERLAGRWLPMWTAKPDRGVRAVFAYTIVPLRNGDIVLKMEIPQEGICTVSKARLTRTQPGVFTTPDRKGIVILMATDYDTYHVSYFRKENKVLVHLYVRENHELNDLMMYNFLAMVNSVGLDSSRRYPLREVDMCTSPPEEE